MNIKIKDAQKETNGLERGSELKLNNLRGGGGRCVTLLGRGRLWDPIMGNRMTQKALHKIYRDSKRGRGELPSL